MVNLLLLPVKFVGVAAVGIAVGAGWRLGSHLADVGIGKKDVTKDKVAEFLAKIREHPWLGKIQGLAVSERKETTDSKQSPCA